MPRQPSFGTMLALLYGRMKLRQVLRGYRRRTIQNNETPLRITVDCGILFVADRLHVPKCAESEVADTNDHHPGPSRRGFCSAGYETRREECAHGHTRKPE